jgi:hypothetical protein
MARPGTRPVTFHGLTIYVPASWATNAVTCGAPTKDTVVLADGPQPACGTVGGASFSTATFTTWRSGSTDPGLTRRSITIDGHRATLGTGVAGRMHVTEVVVPDLRTKVVIGTRSAALGRGLVETAEVTQADANGCPSTMAYVDLTAPPTGGQAQVMVAGRPGAVVICRYLQTYLEQVTTLSAADGARLTDTLNALPTGLSEARRATYSASLCRGAKGSSGDAMDLQDYSIRFSYPHRPTALVYARLSLCGALGFSNGTRTGQRTTPATALLAALGGSDTGWQGDVHPPR